MKKNKSKAQNDYRHAFNTELLHWLNHAKLEVLVKITESYLSQKNSVHIY